MPNLEVMNYNGWQTLVSSDLNVRPIFQDMLRWRTRHKLASNICVTGEPGIGKSYNAMDICRVFAGLYISQKKATKGQLVDRFTVDQIVFTHSGYMDLLIHLKMGKPIMFDEPSYAMGKRDWYKDLQKVLVHTLESQRFLVHPLFIPIINMSLLDKTIRKYLVQFQIHVVGRGHAFVYRLSPSQINDKVYREFMCELFYHQFDHHLCSKDSCLGCKLLDSCPIFRAQYERKKRSIQFERYDQAKEDAIAKESSELTEKQIENMIMPHVKELISDRTGWLSVGKMRAHLKALEPPVILSPWKTRQIKDSIEAQYPELFEES